ncbi:MAG: dienelactone hydrolase [Actinobacteria bacterium]|nr:dienelactone hydrolase [Actinomycetota bacterium]
MLLAPGAGASRDHHTLVAVEDGLAPFPVSRFDFPYRREGRRTPDKAPKAIACVVEEAVAMAASSGIAANQLVLGGRSYGGRMCSMAAAEGLPAAGLVLLSYPLHPPGKPDKLRVEHFARLDVPCLFVSGDNDAFGKPEEFEEHRETIPGPVTQVWLKGGHDPRNQDRTIVDAIRTWLSSLGGPR